MIKRDLKKFSRTELLELLIEQTEENERLKAELRDAENKLLDRRLVCENAGSLAEAALQLNKVFEAAQAACDQYTENIKLLSDPDAVKHTEEKCSEMLERAKAEADAYWEKINKRVEKLASRSPTLKKLLEQDLNDEEDGI